MDINVSMPPNGITRGSGAKRKSCNTRVCGANNVYRRAKTYSSFREKRKLGVRGANVNEKLATVPIQSTHTPFPPLFFRSIAYINLTSTSRTFPQLRLRGSARNASCSQRTLQDNVRFPFSPGQCGVSIKVSDMLSNTRAYLINLRSPRRKE